MAFIVSECLPSDAESLIMDCDCPALQGNPLHELMFPKRSAEDSEEIILWMIDYLRPSLSDPRMKWFKACTSDGTVVGFAGWTVPLWAKEPGERGGPSSSREPPRALDIRSWLAASRRFAAEKRRVLKDQDAIYRLNTIAVNPAYQGKGVGSTLMAWGCDQADKNKADAFVMASPAGLRLYKKFGFEEVGTVHLDTGTITSMIRRPRSYQLPMGSMN
ncbi:hypothetical protein FQN54_002749 [Arachnomyces sp. PD_36]|nr:hypothetical protein FQN54_002749 [Arachnomyces sp. PD_36]